jgi:hypothetical protein
MQPNWDVLEHKVQKGVDYTQARKAATAARKNQKGIEL